MEKDIIYFELNMPEYDIFISYARRDGTPLARQLAQDLRAVRLNVFWDQDSIPPGVNWEDTLDSALEEATHLLVILTPYSVKSEEVTAEWRPMLSKGKNIIPLLYQPCEIPRRLTMRQYIDFQNMERYPLALTELIGAINSFTGTTIQPDLTADELMQRAQSYFESGQMELAAQDYLAISHNGNPHQRMQAARSIGQTRLLKMLPHLITWLERENEDQVRLMIFPVIRGNVTYLDWRAMMPDLGNYMVKYLTDKNPEIRKEAIRVLAYGNMLDFIPRMGEMLLRDQDESVRVQAALSLGRLKDAGASKLLLDALVDRSSEVRKAVISALQVHGNPGTLPALEIVARSDRDSDVRRAAKEAIAAIPTKS